MVWFWFWVLLGVFFVFPWVWALGIAAVVFPTQRLHAQPRCPGSPHLLGGGCRPRPLQRGAPRPPGQQHGALPREQPHPDGPAKSAAGAPAPRELLPHRAAPGAARTAPPPAEAHTHLRAGRQTPCAAAAVPVPCAALRCAPAAATPPASLRGGGRSAAARAAPGQDGRWGGGEGCDAARSPALPGGTWPQQRSPRPGRRSRRREGWRGRCRRALPRVTPTWRGAAAGRLSVQREKRNILCHKEVARKARELFRGQPGTAVSQMHASSTWAPANAFRSPVMLGLKDCGTVCTSRDGPSEERSGREEEYLI